MHLDSPNSLIKTVSMEGFTPKICGQLVDRIRSTSRVGAGNEWEGTAKPLIFLAATLEKANTYVFCRAKDSGP